MSQQDIYLAVSLDVEEEGLFGGQYARRDYSTANTASLTRLAPLYERGVRPTLFCAHSVLADAPSCHALAHVRKLAPTLPKDHLMVVNLSGRGDKDIFTVAKYMGVEITT